MRWPLDYKWYFELSSHNVFCQRYKNNVSDLNFHNILSKKWRLSKAHERQVGNVRKARSRKAKLIFDAVEAMGSRFNGLQWSGLNGALPCER